MFTRTGNKVHPPSAPCDGVNGACTSEDDPFISVYLLIRGRGHFLDLTAHTELSRQPGSIEEGYAARWFGFQKCNIGHSFGDLAPVLFLDEDFRERDVLG